MRGEKQRDPLAGSWTLDCGVQAWGLGVWLWGLGEWLWGLVGCDRVRLRQAGVRAGVQRGGRARGEAVQEDRVLPGVDRLEPWQGEGWGSTAPIRRDDLRTGPGQSQ